ncbi:hypothetical protein ACJMK2_035232 [Sinanodonta woodiana]|uniref:N-acetylglucosamine-1-phosphotransferase subunit gamma n=1 Tax=Sinanodonta woodiana TaxID=1069815 RepID=A0ABD3WU78_SINWO
MASSYTTEIAAMHNKLSFRHYLLFIFVQVSFLVVTGSNKVSIKIVEEPSSYGMLNNYNAHNSYQESEKRLKMRVKPSNFSGPVHFQRLVGHCFNKTESNYRYELCPFSNVTQHEQSLRWNPYSGILGVWQEWEIVNNTFVAMVMGEGDNCGKIQRSVRVIFECASKHEIKNITEPKTCNYQLVFLTPYVCHKHAMLVYPTLSEELQTEWNVLEGQLQQNLITDKGYNKRLHKIFERAGYCLSLEQKERISHDATQKELKVHKEEAGEFATLAKCSEEYKKLKDEVEGLRTLLALNKDTVNNDNNRGGTHVDLLGDHEMEYDALG